MEANSTDANALRQHDSTQSAAEEMESKQRPEKIQRRRRNKLAARHKNNAAIHETDSILVPLTTEDQSNNRHQVLQEFDPLHVKPSVEDNNSNDNSESITSNAPNAHARTYAETTASQTAVCSDTVSARLYDLRALPLRRSLHEASWPALSNLSARDENDYHHPNTNETKDDEVHRGSSRQTFQPSPSNATNIEDEDSAAWRTIVYRTVPALEHCAVDAEPVAAGADRSRGSRGDENDWRVFTYSALSTLTLDDLRKLPELMRYLMNEKSQQLIDLLETRERRLERMEKRCLMLTAILQAFSTKQVADSVLHFSILPRDGLFFQWKRAVSVAVRLPGGIPAELRPDMWSAMADNFLNESHVHWTRLRDFAFGDAVPVDEEDNAQIVKDLHRTGYSLYNDESRAFMREKLHNVLLAYSRWNTRTKYVQGFNTIASVLLDVFDGDEDESLKVLIYLLECVQPINYYDDEFTLLRIDSRIVRQLVQEYDYTLWQHVRRLRCVDSVRSSSTSFSNSNIKIRHKNPPMLDSYTMQWFLLLYASWLPADALVRLWDVIIVYGNELMFPAAVVMWRRLKELIVPAAEEPETFHQILNEVLECTQKCQPSPISIDMDAFIKEVFEIGPIDVEKLRLDMLGMLPPESCEIESDNDDDADEIDNVVSELNDSRNQQQQQQPQQLSAVELSSSAETRDHPLARTSLDELNSPIPTPTKARCFRSQSSSSSAALKQQKNPRRRHLSNDYTYSLGKKSSDSENAVRAGAGGRQRRLSLHNSITVLQRCARRSWQALAHPFSIMPKNAAIETLSVTNKYEDEDDENIAKYDGAAPNHQQQRAQSAPPPTAFNVASGYDDAIDTKFEQYCSEQLELGTLSAASSSALHNRRYAGRRAASASAASGATYGDWQNIEQVEEEDDNDDDIVLPSDTHIFTLLAEQQKNADLNMHDNNSVVPSGSGGIVTLLRTSPNGKKLTPKISKSFGDEYYYHTVQSKTKPGDEAVEDVRKLGQQYKRKVVHFEQSQQVEMPELPGDTILSDMSCQTNEDLYGRQPTPWPANCQTDSFSDSAVTAADIISTDNDEYAGLRDEQNGESEEHRNPPEEATTTEGDEPLAGKINIDAGASGDNRKRSDVVVVPVNTSPRRVVVVASGRRNSSSPLKKGGVFKFKNSNNNAYEGDDESEYRSSGGLSE